ncbi:hypothetical protein DPEC_G00267280 [Dallia pectoralis]|uniref:Uncharacterized protein n=1 Tax=Dallia pectoralis TaxID=75939 RepID=A0ACC2FNY4_DALPE|nr:hypothetical protein DPEC_G00267280 [Dallia pectoralis]
MELPGVQTESTVGWGAMGTRPRTYKSRQLLQALDKNNDYFVDYVPSSRDAINMPPHVLYVILGVIMVVIACYAILGHLINDLYHDLAGIVGCSNVNRRISGHPVSVCCRVIGFVLNVVVILL